jgi:NAD(P)-dependent dehydrogenase (short-subunit alcohol dehydrogenase family)|tara:strand:- start:169 stop:981 length:813 start_codon:yes stop_codon:yes gene_type:complete
MLNKKNALITGAAGLLGFQHALALNELGFNIILIDIDKKNLLLIHNKLKKRIKKNTAVHSYLCDISSESQVKKVSLELKKKKLLIDVLINNADVNPQMDKYKGYFTGRVEDYSIENLTKELKVGIIGTFICSKVFGEHMKIKKKGSIINISSDLGITAPDQRVYHKSENINKVKNFKPIGYSISKHAVIGITKYLATYWAHKNIRCNTLVPGAVFNNQPTFLKKNIIKRIPLNRLATKTDYKKAIQFLATDDSCYMTGQSLIMDGGRTVW